MTQPPSPEEVMLAATRNTLRTGRMAPAQVVRQQLEALTAAGYELSPYLNDGGEAMLLATAKRAFWSGRFRPAEVISVQLAELAAAGHLFEWRYLNDQGACDDFVWGPNSFESCEECGLSFWRHGETESQDNPSHYREES